MSLGRESKPHIGIYGRRNSGKSSLINMLTGQEVAIVSEEPGTTTDPVRKSLEITGFGPVVIVDTAGNDDVGRLGSLRIDRTMETIARVDLAILLITNNLWGETEQLLVFQFVKHQVPFVIVHNKSDVVSLSQELHAKLKAIEQKPLVVEMSITQNKGFSQLVDAIKKSIPEKALKQPRLLGDLVSRGEMVLFITPIDTGAPAGRLILPQVQAIRDALDSQAVAIILKETEAEEFLKSTAIKPALVVIDSQIFALADKIIPKDIPLTSFSVLLARLKGDFEAYLKGTPMIDKLQDGDRVLILESCTHHMTSDDIGRVKIPGWILNYTGKKVEFDFVAGLDGLPRPIADYALAIQCGGCMITPKQIHARVSPALEAQVPITNYGLAIAFLQGTYYRSIEVFNE